MLGGASLFSCCGCCCVSALSFCWSVEVMVPMVLNGVSSNSNELFKIRLVRGSSSVVSSVLAEAVGSTDNDDDGARGMILVRFVRAGWMVVLAGLCCM